jgi:hypothetical protein
MSELEHCRLAHEGKLDALIEKIQSNHVENLPRKKDQVKAANLNISRYSIIKTSKLIPFLLITVWKNRFALGM